VEGRTKIGMTAALVVELDLTVFASTGERRVAQISRLLQGKRRVRHRPEASLGTSGV
jgi:hypothetical protein